MKFTSQLSALRVSHGCQHLRILEHTKQLLHQAVNALEGRIFNGNTIVAKFFDSERFQSDDFE